MYLVLIQSVVQALLDATSHPDVCEATANALAGHTGFETVAVFAASTQSGDLELCALRGTASGATLPELRLGIGEGVAGEAARLVEPVHAKSPGDGAPPLRFGDTTFGSELAVPVTVRNRVVAVLSVLATAPGAFSKEHEDALAIVAQSMSLAWDSVTAAEVMHAKALELDVRRGVPARSAAMEQLRLADRLATVGNLAAGIAHEIGTPLNVAAARASMIAGGELAPAEVTEYARIIVQQVDRISTIVRQLLDFARSRSLRRAPTELADLLHGTVALLRSVAEKNGVTMSVLGADRSVKLAIDPVKLRQVLTNLAMNGIQAMPTGGTLVLEIADEAVIPPPDRRGSPSGYISLHVRDTGTGIRPEHRAHLFEPFFTTKGVGSGTGLGLPVAYGIVSEHGGWIEVESKLGEGSRFTVRLPRADAPGIPPDEGTPG